jgi:hypothetical protein
VGYSQVSLESYSQESCIDFEGGMLASVAGVGCIVAPGLESIRLFLADAAVGDCAIVVCG